MNSNDPAGLNLRVGNPWTLNGAEGGISFKVASIWALDISSVCVSRGRDVHDNVGVLCVLLTEGLPDWSQSFYSSAEDQTEY